MILPLITTLLLATEPPQLVTQADAGKIVVVLKGEEFWVELKYTSGTGYEWHRVPSKNFEQVGERLYRGDGKKGAMKTVIVRLKPTFAAGKADVEFEYKRRFDKGAEPAKTFKVTVKVE